MSITPTEACEIGPGSPDEVRAALLHFLETASKGVAHLTDSTAKAEVKKLHLATTAIWRLVVVHVYHPRGDEWPEWIARAHHQLSVTDRLPHPLEEPRPPR